VDGRRGGDAGHASAHELKESHLGSGILASNSVGAELEVADATLNLLTVRVVQVRVQNLLSEGEGLVVHPGPDNCQVLAHLLVVDVVALLGVGHLDLLGERGILNGGKGATAQGARLREEDGQFVMLFAVRWLLSLHIDRRRIAWVTYHVPRCGSGGEHDGSTLSWLVECPRAVV